MSVTLMTALAGFLSGALGAFLIFKLGGALKLVDVPNERSSHSIPTPRGGGIGILTAFSVGAAVFTREPYFILAGAAMGIMGLLEDRFNFPSRTRLLVHLAVSSGAILAYAGPPLTVLSALSFVFWTLFLAGTANFYNFMDGINGIAGLCGAAAFALMAAYSYFAAGDRGIALVSIAVAAGCVGFLPFNFPRSRIFMGDSGSLLLGFVFALMVLRLSASAADFVCLSMFLSPFYADSLLTLFYRWRRGEDIMKAHRGHLYQYLCNELLLPHWAVSLVYTAVQIFIGVASLLAHLRGGLWPYAAVILFSALFAVSYKVVKDISPAGLGGRDIAA